jgi:ABC-type sugar transport system ATPase subunit
MALLEVRHITKQAGEKLIVDDISFKQEALKKIAIAGESGAGKTTLLKMISGHAQPTGGKVLFDGKRVIGPEEKLLPGYKQIAFLSQDHDLLHNYRVEELIWFENQLSHEEAATLFEVCQVDHLLKRRTGELSGGEQQRIALCMLLIKCPKLLVLDEPFSNLDQVHKNILKTVIEDIGKRLQITCTLTSHDPHDTLSWADEILVMQNGRLIQQGTPEEIYYKPMNEYVAGMFGKYNLLNPAIAALFGLESNGNDVITRPEHFTISTTGSGVKGTIRKISFWGSYYEAEILVNKIKIIVKTNRNNLKTGSEVWMRLQQDKE